MTIKLWDWLEDLNWFVGADFPEADEDALWRCADAWTTAAAGLRRLEPEAIAIGDRVLISLGGESGEAFADLWRQYTGPDGLVERAAAACEQLAAGCDHVAIEVEYAKLQYIAALVILAATLAALTAALVAGGISALGMPAAIAGAQFAIRLVLMRLITAMAVGAIMNVALDGLAQSIQLLAGHRHDWDLTKTVRAGEDGAIYGAAGAGVFLAAGRFAPGLLRNPVGLAVPLAATGGVGGVAAPLAHGELPTGRDFLLALTSGVAGGMGPDLVHGADPLHSTPSSPDLSRLGALDHADMGLDPVPGNRVSALAVSDMADGITDSHDGLAPGDGDGTLDNGPSRTGAAAAAGLADSTPRRSDSPDAVRPEDPGQLAGATVARADPAEAVSGPRSDQPAVGPDGAATSGGLPGQGADRPPSGARSELPSQQVYLDGERAGGPMSANAGTDGMGPVAALARTEVSGHPPGAPTVGRSGSGAPTPVASSFVATTATAAPAGASGHGGSLHHDGATAVHSGSDTAGAATPLLAPVAPAGVHLGTGSAMVAANPGPPSSVDGTGWAARDASGPQLPGWIGTDNATLTGLQNQAADLLLNRAKEVEPRVTPVARDIARDVGGTLLGERDRLKTEESFKSKLAQRLGRSSQPLPVALTKMKDSLRYTVGLPEERYARGAQEAVGLLLDRGFRPVGEFRSWRDQPGYLGYNTFWSDPASGHVFEVQFHTESSFLAKTISHSEYEDLRSASKEDQATPAYAALQAAHDAYFKDVPIPAGAAEVRLPRDVPRHDPTGDLPPLPHPRSADGLGVPVMGDGRRPATDAEALDLARQNVFDTNAGLAFYGADDDIRAFARAVHPTDGYVTLDLHGSQHGFQIGNRKLTPSQFADVLQELRAAGVLRLPAGVGIKLLSCDTGLGGLNSPAAVLARRLGVEVVAPDQPVWTALNGDEVVSSPTVIDGNFVPTDPPDGNWFRFIPVAQVLASSSSAPGAPPPAQTSGTVRDGPASRHQGAERPDGERR